MARGPCVGRRSRRARVLDAPSAAAQVLRRVPGSVLWMLEPTVKLARSGLRNNLEARSRSMPRARENINPVLTHRIISFRLRRSLRAAGSRHRGFAGPLVFPRPSTWRATRRPTCSSTPGCTARTRRRRTLCTADYRCEREPASRPRDAHSSSLCAGTHARRRCVSAPRWPVAARPDRIHGGHGAGCAAAC